MSKPPFHVASGFSRLDRDNRKKLIDEFMRDGSLVSDNGGHIVEVLNHCIERRIAFEMVWGKHMQITRRSP